MLLYVSPLIFSAVFGLFLALFIYRIRYAPGSRSLVVLILAAALWCGGYAMEFISPDLGTKILWAKIQYFGIATIPCAWFFFAHRYLGSDEWPERWLRYRAVLAIIPVLTVILVWTNEFHHLIWRAYNLQPHGPVQILEMHYGPWFWIYWIFGYILMFLGAYWLAKTLRGSVRLYRWQIRLALFAIVVPWIGNLIYVTGLNPIEHLDWTPFAFIISGLLLTISLFRYQLADILPIAQQEVFDEQSDGLIVLNIHDCIVDLNRTAQKMILMTGKRPVGKPFARYFPDLAPSIEQTGRTGELHGEIARGEGLDQRFYDLHISPLTGTGLKPMGRLIVLHEITQLKLEQVRLEQARAQLEQIVSERTEELRKTVEKLQFELVQRTLAEQRLEEVIESAPDAMLLVDRDGAIKMVNVQTETLFGYTREELLIRTIENLMPIQQRGRNLSYSKEFFANPAIRQINLLSDLTARRKDGSEFPVELSLGPINTTDGVWAACSIRDISQRKRVEAEQNQLLEEIKQSREELRALATRLQEVQEIERREIASELHDRIGQNLTGLNLNLQIVENQLSRESSPTLRSRLEDSLKLVEETTRQVRDVMADLHPPVLDDYGLVSALQWYSASFSQRTGISSQVMGIEFVPRLPGKVEMVLFRLVQEALNNVAKHAHASRVDIILESFQGSGSLIIKDNGLGFDPQDLRVATGHEHWGLITMQQRVDSIGAQLEIDSALGQGTRICIHFRRDINGD